MRTPSFLSNEEALVKLVSDKSLDVVVVVAGQPAKLLVDMKPEARQLIKLLKFDPTNAGQRGRAEDLLPGDDPRASYPNLLTEDIPGAGGARRSWSPTTTRWAARCSRLRGFARSLCQNFPKLQAEGHPKWKRGRAGACPSCRRGWLYYPPMERELKSCIAGAPAAGAAKASARHGPPRPRWRAPSRPRCSAFASDAAIGRG